MYKAIFFDLDGTLTNRDKVITPRTLRALMEAQKRGKKVVLASGRPTYGVMPLAEQLELEKYGDLSFLSTAESSWTAARGRLFSRRSFR